MRPADHAGEGEHAEAVAHLAEGVAASHGRVARCDMSVSHASSFRLIDEEELGRAQQHLQVSPERRHGQHLLLVLLVAAAGRVTPAIMPSPIFGLSSFLRRVGFAVFVVRPPSSPRPPCALRRRAAARRRGTRGRPSAPRRFGSRPKSSAVGLLDAGGVVGLRLHALRASFSACCCMKSLFIRNSRCSGTLVLKRCSALIVGAGKSNSCRNESSL